jgi:hypothetical protein
VLFLALAVQGNAYREMARAIRRLAAPRADLRVGRALGYALLWQFAYFVILSGVAGELIALISLYQGHDQPGFGPLILVMTTILLLAVAAGPTRMLTGRDLGEPPKGAVHQVALGQAAQQEPGAPAEPVAISEMGETDTGG